MILTGHTVGVLVDDDPGLKRAVTDWSTLGPQIHAHTAWFSICRSGKVCVVGASPILGIDNCEVAALASLSIIAGLEVVRRLGESKLVK